MCLVLMLLLWLLMLCCLLEHSASCHFMDMVCLSILRRQGLFARVVCFCCCCIAETCCVFVRCMEASFRLCGGGGGGAESRRMCVCVKLIVFIAGEAMAEAAALPCTHGSGSTPKLLLVDYCCSLHDGSASAAPIVSAPISPAHHFPTAATAVLDVLE